MRVSEQRDGVLVERARMGDAAAFEALVHRHARAVYAVALAILANHDDAEDACQEAWTRGLERLEECRSPARFVFWLLQIVRNQARNLLQRRRVRAAAQLETAFGPEGPPGADDPHRNLQRELLRERLRAALAEIPEDQREVLLLHDLAGWPHRPIADALGISEVLSRQRLFQARARMRALLGKDGEG